MGEWQPIETAPRDGTEVRLSLMGFDSVKAFWDEKLQVWVLSRPIHMEKLINPPYWKPLPEPSQ